jgi:hypothetical protein
MLQKVVFRSAFITYATVEEADEALKKVGVT